MNIWVILDDTCPRSEVIRDVIGEKGFADIVVKKRALGEYYHDGIKKLFPGHRWRLVHSAFEFHELAEKLKEGPDSDTRVLHCFSNFIISDEGKALLSYEKLRYIDEDCKVVNGKKTAAVMFCGTKSYIRYLHAVCSGRESVEAAGDVEDFFEMEGLTDIGVVGNFIKCVTGNFDSRYFNSLQGDEYTVVKASANKRKIKSEYTYYHLLPDDMKMWYVLPFQYQENGQEASYRMERMHMTDLAVKWVHGSIGVAEFEEILDKYFYFFQCRHQKSVSKAEYEEAARRLYVDKVLHRVRDLKDRPEYGQIAKSIAAGCEGGDIDGLVQKYLELKDAIERRNEYPRISVIGHGDPCFANALYNKSTKTLKFVDPKGALEEGELWMDPYYDIAKLSHSVCGRYDFFNQALFEIRVNSQFEYELGIEFDNSAYVGLFKSKLEEHGYDYLTVRIYEASLFLSMLPLHIDAPHKVFGFIINVQNILEEIAGDVQ